MEQTTVTALQEMGLTLSEAKIYIALLASSPANGNQISRSASVPSAKVYENLERLRERGLIAMVDNAQYVPLDLEDFLREREARLKEVGQLLRETVRQKVHDLHGEILWHGRGYTALLERAVRLIELSQEELLISIWPHELGHIMHPLDFALERGVKVAIMIFATPQEVQDSMKALARHSHLFAFSHAMLPTVHVRHGKQAAFVADSTAALLMSGASSHEWLGVWTSNPAVVGTVTNYIRHDIYINKVFASSYDDLAGIYGSNLERLLDVHEDGIKLEPTPPTHKVAEKGARRA